MTYVSNLKLQTGPFTYQLRHGLFSFGLCLHIDAKSRQVCRELRIQFGIVACVAIDIYQMIVLSDIFWSASATTHLHHLPA